MTEPTTPLSRASIGTLPTPVRQVVPFAPLQGSVIVRGLMLEEQLANAVTTAAERTPRDGETDAEAAARANGAMALRLLSQVVIEEGGAPLLPLSAWQALGQTHPGDVLDLSGVALRLAGSDVDAAAKNS